MTPPTPPAVDARPAQQTLAQRARLRELRAERLARLRSPEAPDGKPETAAGSQAGGDGEPEAEASGALEDFLRALTAGLDEGPPARPAPLPPAALVVALPRTGVAEAPSDLGRLPGAGPGLLWALRRAGLVRLADLAALETGELAARLGSIGPLVPARAWIAFARTAA